MRELLRPVLFWLTVLCAVFPAGAPALAQGPEATLSGSVVDTTGTLLPGATVTVTNEKTGEARVVKATEGGLYRVTQLKPSVYTIRAVVEGLAPTEYTGIELSAGLAMALDLQLSPPGVTETVVVTGAAPSLDLSSARMGVNVNAREVQDLPINGRQMSQLYLQAPGAVNTGTGTFGDIRFSGRAVEQNVLRYDGVEGTISSTPAPATSTARCRRPSSCRRASRTSRSSAWSRTLSRGVRAGHRQPDLGGDQVRQQPSLHGAAFE
ncbi:MAG: carboxypeptidase-like regulatory domain-containing protein [Vicinamibacterales bacterium]